jgi:NAD+ synthase (glutamine-hydrolysing)
MAQKLRIVLAQLNLQVGDISGNLQKHLQAAVSARDELSADIIVFPELSLTGYPPEDLLLRHDFLQATQTALENFIAQITGIYCLISYPEQTAAGIYNACAFIYNGKIIAQYRKQHLPNYGVFDEQRYFIAGNIPCVVAINNILVGIIICEDAWAPGPIQQAAAQGAQVLLIPNASPFETDKHEQRVAILAKQAQQYHLPIVYVNQVGGQDELIFDGGSMVINAQGNVAQLADFFQETLLPVDISFANNHTSIATKTIKSPSPIEKIYRALVLSVHDYIEKNHFPGVIVGVSGGIDSALTLAIAVDALGKERVQAIMMPSRFTADISLEDAKSLSQQLGIQYDIIAIEPAYTSLLAALAPVFSGKKPDVTEENIQARCRAILLMAISNKTGKLVLTTGNRSELAVGYCTLYGDMAGGFAVLKDVPKTLVYELANYRNQISPVIPQRIITRPPTAELAENQKDEDTLPPYAILDKILAAYLNQGQSAADIIAAGSDPAIVKKVVNLIRQSEYKRRQAAIGPRINSTSFGKDWRYPVTNGF